jgi:hypothetical protein
VKHWWLALEPEMIALESRRLILKMRGLFMEKLVLSHPIIMEVTLYVALEVNPDAMKNHLGALVITLESGRLSTKLQSLILEQKWKEEMLFYIPGLGVRSHDGSIIGCDFKKVVV